MPEALAKITHPVGGIVRVAGDIVAALAEYQGIQAGLDKAMPDAIMKIQGRPFRKKAYWRAVARAFNLSVSMTTENVEKNATDWGYTVTYRATAPNGAFADGDGSCFASEKRNALQRTVHNIRSHAHTRAWNRAVSNLVGFGEVSAEEVEHESSSAHDPLPGEQPQVDILGPDPEEPGSNDGPAAESPQVISEPQRRRLFAISKAAQAVQSWDDAKLKSVMDALLKKHGFSSSKEITRAAYDAIVEEVSSWK